MPVSLTSLLAALQSMEESQRVPPATPPPFCMTAHDEHLVHRHSAIRSASKAPVVDKLTSPWELAGSLEMTVSSDSVASVAQTASSDSTVDAAFGVETSTVEGVRPGETSQTLSKDGILVRTAKGQSRQGSYRAGN
ncbi:hypothetical protein T484DRAFT_2019695 [Baffinella frigidus]|nr:hypothetical protein T484DRAFT_2019695 [Cryptophyta sp. CCMP2293]